MNVKPMSLVDIRRDAENGGMLGPQDARVLLDEIDWLKRVGHEFCDELREADIERNRLKAELAGLRTGFDAQNEVIAGLKSENEKLKKRIEDLSPFNGTPLTGPSLKCLACGGYHYGMQGLPCPNMKITAQAELPETRSGQIGAAMGKGDKQ